MIEVKGQPWWFVFLVLILCGTCLGKVYLDRVYPPEDECSSCCDAGTDGGE